MGVRDQWNAQLPVTVVEEPRSSTTSGAPRPVAPARVSVGSIEINIRGTVIRVRGPIDEACLRTVLRALASTA